VEKGKSQFAGPEVRGKTLGVVGLGAIGVIVANDAAALGMRVIGYDPFISVESAWGLSRAVTRATSLDMLISQSDYISLHLPLSDETKGIIDESRIHQMKPGVKVLNFARGGLVDNAALLKAISDGIVARYVTDFPDEELLTCHQVIGIPHLGASTPEAEENCAIMAVDQIMEFLERGNIKNSVNYPACEMDLMGESRIILANQNIPNMVGQITTVLANDGINISEMLNRHQGDFAYNIIDIEGPVAPEIVDKLWEIEGIIMARLIPMEE
jgi:D-3-phosphoglycerate dehydrogenase